MAEAIHGARRQIESAFEGLQYPSGCAVVSTADGPSLVRNFTDKDWHEVSVEVLTYSSLYFFTKEGFQYFIPAFLLASLDEENVELRGRVVRALAPRDPGDASQEAAFRERVHLLTSEQRAAVGTFLDVMRDYYADEFRKMPLALTDRSLWTTGHAKGQTAG